MISPNHLAKLNKRFLWSKKFFNESYGKLSAEKIINAKEGKKHLFLIFVVFIEKHIMICQKKLDYFQIKRKM